VPSYNPGANTRPGALVLLDVVAASVIPMSLLHTDPGPNTLDIATVVVVLPHDEPQPPTIRRGHLGADVPPRIHPAREATLPTRT
jgi:hypothetical protein